MIGLEVGQELGSPQLPPVDQVCGLGQVTELPNPSAGDIILGFTESVTSFSRAIKT